MLYDFQLTSKQADEAINLNKGKIIDRYQRDDGTQIITLELSDDPYVWWKDKWRRWRKNQTLDQMKK